MTTTMTIEAHAKINLTLEVFKVRSDGYHALRSVVMPVSLADTLEVEDAISLSSDTGYADDLCLKAAKVLAPGRGASIRVTKRIPAGGGLGGGSADAAAVLLALNDVWGLMRTREELMALGAQVGSDVPSLVCGGAVVMEGRGEVVRPVLPAEGSVPRALPVYHLVLLNPGVASSTAAVYAKCEGREPTASLTLGKMLAALSSGDPSRVAAALQNDLTAPARALHPEIGEALDELRAGGALGVSMSGSGSTVFGVYADEAAAKAEASRLLARGLRAWAVHTCG